MNTPTPTPRTDAQAGWAIANQYGQSTARELLADPEGAFVHSVFARALETELATLTAEVKRLKRAYEYDHKCLCEVQDRCELWKQRAQKAEAEVERLKSQVADPQKLHANCLRTLNEGQIAHLFGERMTEIVNRAERAEAALTDWSALKLWGGTPEIIHEFIKGQQARIHHCQDLEAELITDQARLDWLESPTGVDWQCEPWQLIVNRARIDSAMKEDAK